MGLIHRQQIAESAAIAPTVSFPAQRRSAKGAFLFRRLFYRICFPIFLPPLDPARIAAKPPLLPRTPFRLELLPTVGADLLWPRTLTPLFQYLLLMILLTALVTAEPPPPPRTPFPLVYLCPTFRAYIYRHSVMSFCVVVSVSARLAAKFLPRDVAGWGKFFPTV